MIGSWRVFALAVCALLVAAPAQAAENHVAAGGFDLAAAGSAPSAIAVDEATGHVYALSGGTLEKFNAAGDPANFSSNGESSIQGCTSGWGCNQIAIDNSGGPNQGVIYVSDRTPYSFGGEGVRALLPSGVEAAKVKTYSGSLGSSPCGVMVDGDGHLLIAHSEWFGNVTQGFVDQLEVPNWATEPLVKPTVVGAFGPDFAYPCRSAIDSDEVIYQLGAHNVEEAGPVRAFPPHPFGEPNLTPGELPASLFRPSTEIDGGSASDLAVDGGDNLFVSRTGEGRVRKFDPAGTVVEVISGGELQEPTAIGVNRASGTVYVADRSGPKDIRVYAPVAVTDSLTGPFEAATAVTGALGGTADPAGAGPISGCDFQYVTVAKHAASEFDEAATVPCSQATPISTSAPVSASVAGLSVEEQYAYRLRTTGPNGTSNGSVRRFTPHSVVGLATEPAEDVAPRSATLVASFLANGEATDVHFEYGLNKAYGTETEVETIGGSGAVAVEIPIDGLELETTYHVRAIAGNGSGTSVAEGLTFTTPPAVAGLRTDPVGTISQEAIQLKGEFTGTGLATRYWFQYGLTKAYGMTSDAVDGVTTTGSTPASVEVDEFRGYGEYHYRLVAENDLGVTYGKDQAFESLPAPAPAVRGTSVSNVTPGSASLAAEINPNRWTTSYVFEWGPSTAYGSSTSLANTVPGLGNQFSPVSTEIADLTPGTTYHYRVVALNITGTTNGPDQTFTTPAPPVIESGEATAVTADSARLAALVAPQGAATTVRFEYGPTGAYGTSTAPVAIGDGQSLAPAAATLGGLTPRTGYHFRVVAENRYGTVAGPDLAFTTAAGASVSQPSGNGSKKCPRGKVKRKGKCVKKKQAKRGGKRTGKGGRRG